MIFLTNEQRDIMTLLAFPTVTGKWTRLTVDHVSTSKGISAHQKFQAFAFNARKNVATF